MSGGTSTTREVRQLSLFLGLTKFVLLHPIHCSEVCSELGGFLPHDYSGYSALSGYGYGDEWHWVGYGADETRYLAFLANRLSLECHISPQHPPGAGRAGPPGGGRGSGPSPAPRRSPSAASAAAPSPCRCLLRGRGSTGRGRGRGRSPSPTRTSGWGPRCRGGGQASEAVCSVAEGSIRWQDRTPT